MGLFKKKDPIVEVEKALDHEVHEMEHDIQADVDAMTVDNVRSELESLLYNKVYRNKVLEEYDRIIQILGPAGASGTAAREMVALLKK